MSSALLLIPSFRCSMPSRRGCRSQTAKSICMPLSLYRKSFTCWRTICLKWSTSWSQQLWTITWTPRTTQSILPLSELLMHLSGILVLRLSIHILLLVTWEHHGVIAVMSLILWFSLLPQQITYYFFSPSAPRLSFWMAKQRWTLLRRLQVCLFQWLNSGALLSNCFAHVTTVSLSLQTLWQSCTLASPGSLSRKCCPCSGISWVPLPTAAPSMAEVAAQGLPPSTCAKPFMPRWGPAWSAALPPSPLLSI